MNRLRLALLIALCAVGGVRAQPPAPAAGAADEAGAVRAETARVDTAAPVGAGERGTEVAPIGAGRETGEAPAREGDGGPAGRDRDNLVVSIVLAIVVLGGAVARLPYLRQRRHHREGRAGRTGPSAGVHPDRPGGGAPVSDALQQRIVAMGAEITRLSAAVGALQADLRRLQRPEARPAPAAETAPLAADPTPPASPPSPVETMARHFVDWCRTRGMLAGKLPQFAEHLAAGLPGAVVTPVYRDLDVAGRTVAFAPTHSGTAAPAEYWLVELDGERWLLPQPQGPAQFRDLAPVFEGHVAPRDLQAFTPASVTEQGGSYTLDRPGRVG